MTFQANGTGRKQTSCLIEMSDTILWPCLCKLEGGHLSGVENLADTPCGIIAQLE
jgi:hypothetical protein